MFNGHCNSIGLSVRSFGRLFVQISSKQQLCGHLYHTHSNGLCNLHKHICGVIMNLMSPYCVLSMNFSFDFSFKDENLNCKQIILQVIIVTPSVFKISVNIQYKQKNDNWSRIYFLLSHNYHLIRAMKCDAIFRPICTYAHCLSRQSLNAEPFL